jgi:outer membrane protein assembly factor BamB
MHRRGLSALAAAPFLMLTAAPAADWPQWRGPDRSGVSADTGLLKSWPQGGPKLLWSIDQAGHGYSGPAVVGDRLYSVGDVTEEFVFALDVTTGKQLWRQAIGRPFANNRGGGSRCTPTVDGDVLYVLSPNGDLACLETATGQIRWQKNLQKDLHGRMMSGWGYSESPLIDGDKLICCPGGEDGTVAALDKKTGALIWRSKGLTENAAYASLVVAEVGGIRQYVVMTDRHTAGVAANDGRRLWQEAVGVNGTAVIPTPVVRDNLVFATCGYLGRGGSCGLIKLTPDGQGGIKSELVYKNTNLGNHHGGVVLIGDHLYGYAEADRGKDVRGGWECVELKTGKIVWSSNRLEKGSITYADGKLFCYGESSGRLVMVEASPTDWKELGRLTIPRKSSLRKDSGQIWTHPVVANGRLYLRDRELLFCYDVRAGGRAAE